MINIYHWINPSSGDAVNIFLYLPIGWDKGGDYAEKLLFLK